MKNNNSKQKVIIITTIIIKLCLLTCNSYGHSGRTDSNGGHKDNNNKSGLGNYHYHCGGNPAHLHPNGVCPYTSSSSSSSSSFTSSSEETSSKSNLVDVTGITINEFSNSIDVGKTMMVTATVIPDNATDKNIIWESSDDSIATISSEGEVTAKKSGVVYITASTSNGKSNTVEIKINEIIKPDNNEYDVIKSSTNNNTTNESDSNNNQEDSSSLSGVLTLGLLGGGGYLGYKKHKKKKDFQKKA